MSLRKYKGLCVEILILFFLVQLNGVSAKRSGKKKGGRLNVSLTAFVDKILHRTHYDKFARPGLDFGPNDETTYVYVDIFIISISSINEIDMDYRMDIYLRQTWQDKRLAYDSINKSITLNYNQVSEIWVPDLFFRNEKNGVRHDITVPNRLLRIWPNGTILYSQRLSLVLDCQMFLEKYPMDNQTCNLIIGSYGYTTDELDFIWHPHKNPLNMRSNLVLPEFEITGSSARNCDANFTTGAFACLEAEIKIERQFEFYLLQTYVPSIMIVILSWVSFWIDIDAVPARITLGLLTVLTMTTQASSISDRLPRVSYVKAIDVWMAACLVFVFSALIEYSAVNVLYRRRKNRMMRKYGISYDENGSNEDQEEYQPLSPESQGRTEPQKSSNGLPLSVDGELRKRPAEGGKENNEGLPRATMVTLSGGAASYPRKPKPRNGLCNNEALLVDVMSRIGFPLAFLAFSLIYWIYYVYIVV